MAEQDFGIAVWGSGQTCDFVFFKRGQRAGQNTISLTENQIAGEDACEFFYAGWVQLMADDDVTGGRAICTRVLIQRGDGDLVEPIAVHPPTSRGLFGVPTSGNAGCAQKVSNRVFGNGSTRAFAHRLQRDNLARAVRKHKEVAVFGLPGVLARLANRGRVTVPEEDQRCK